MSTKCEKERNLTSYRLLNRDAWSSVQRALTRQHRARIVRVVPWMEKGILRVRCFDIAAIEGVLTRYYGTRTANVIVRLESDERGMLGAQDVPPVAPIYRVLAKCPVTSQQEGMERNVRHTIFRFHSWSINFILRHDSELYCNLLERETARRIQSRM